jgi:hypothetical protein
MERFEIVKQLREYIQQGRLLSKAQNGAYYHGFDRMINRKELFATRLRSIVATDIDASDWFNELIKSDRIMDSSVVKSIHRDITSDHLINKACMRGEMIKFDEFGKGCILYIK